MSELIEQLRNSDKATVEQARRLLRVGTDTIRYGLQAGVFPFGVAVKMASGSYVYDIRAKALLDYYERGIYNA